MDRMHAQRRAVERYGANLSADDLRAVEASIASGRSVLARRQAHGSEWHLVRAGGVAMIAVVAPRNGRMVLVTFLPATALNAGESRKRNAQRPALTALR